MAKRLHPLPTAPHRVAARSRAGVERAVRKALLRLRAPGEREAVMRALERRDVARAMNLLGLDLSAEALAALSENFAEVRRELRAVYQAGALAAVAELPKVVRLQTSFNLDHPRARAFLQRYEFDLVVGIQDRQVKALRRVLTRSTDGLITPFTTAQEVTSFVGLTPRQASWAENFREQLIQGTQTPVDDLGRLRRLTPVHLRRLRATDRRAALAHVAGDVVLSPQGIRDLVERYTASLVEHRAENIARTETIRAAHEGQDEEMRQAVEEGLLNPDETRRFWIWTPDERVRATHRQIGSLNPRGVGIDEPFVTNIPGRPTVMRPPAEPNCRCSVRFEVVPTEPLEEVV